MKTARVLLQQFQATSFYVVICILVQFAILPAFTKNNDNIFILMYLFYRTVLQGFLYLQKLQLF